MNGASPRLDQSHFLPLAVRGLDDGWSAYVHAMQWFENRLYCGTFRANLCFKLRQKTAMHHWPAYPVRCPQDLLAEVDCRARIWRFDPRAAAWERVLVAPEVAARDGGRAPREVSYRGMAVLQGRSDRKPALYVTPFSLRETAGAMILRSEDGESFEPVSEPGLGLDGVASFRFLTAFAGRVYTAPVGRGQGLPNYSLYPIVFESDDPARGRWREVSPPGFGDPRNIVVFDLAAFDGHLYAGTMNVATGFELWKARPEGDPPYAWTKVLERGAYRGPFSEAVVAMCAFRGALYIGTGIQDGGYDRTNEIGPAAAEIIRVYPDDSWDLVVGSPRLTPAGLKQPTSGYRPGFGNVTNGYIWRMCVHDDRLYAGTMCSASFLRYASLDPWPDALRRVLERRGVEAFVERHAGCELWSTGDGDEWSPVTTTGFDNVYNMGVRNLVSTPWGLAVGTANPFGPEVATRTDGRWDYVTNPRGGAEVWLGASEIPAPIRDRAPAGALDEGRPAAAYGLAPPDARPAVAARPVRADERAEYELGSEALSERRSAMDVVSVSEALMAEAVEFYNLEVQGAAHLPRAGAALLLGNNPAVPLFVGDTVVAAPAFYTLNAVWRSVGRAARLVASIRYEELARSEGIAIETMDRLGYVPDAPGNVARLLEMGELVLAYPEASPSAPPYRTRRFAPEYVRAAWRAGADVVPVAFVGTHESHLLIEDDGRQVLVNKADRLRAKYLVHFLAPVPVRAVIEDPDDDEQVELICETLRRTVQAELDREAADRPLVAVARHLQERHGGAASGRELGR